MNRNAGSKMGRRVSGGGVVIIQNLSFLNLAACERSKTHALFIPDVYIRGGRISHLIVYHT